LINCNFVSKIDVVRTEEVGIFVILLLLYYRKTVGESVLVILLVKYMNKLECKYDTIVS
jgi:hypothetical protein